MNVAKNKPRCCPRDNLNASDSLAEGPPPQSSMTDSKKELETLSESTIRAIIQSKRKGEIEKKEWGCSIRV